MSSRPSHLDKPPEAPSEPDVVAFGLDLFPNHEQTATDEDGRLLCAGSFTDAAVMHRLSANLFILPFDAGASMTTMNRYISAPLAECDTPIFTAVCKSIDLALERGASVCFVVIQGTPFPVLTQQGVSSYNRDDVVARAEIDSLLSFRDNVVGFRYLGKGMRSTLLHTDIEARAGEFHPYTREYAAAAYAFEIGESKDITVLATAADEPVSIARDYKRGRLFWVPLRSSTSEGDHLPAIVTLVRCIATYRSRTLAEEPAWVPEQFTWFGEQALRDQEAEALQALEKLKPLKERYSSLRRILWARDEPLRVAVSHFLEEMGLTVDDDERYREDFWLLANGERAAIGEVKGINGNVSPSDLAHLVSHRKDAGLADKFPGIFVALTFANTESVEKRRIEPNVCRRAKEDNILLLRTIDLAWFYDGMNRGQEGFTVEALWDCLRAGGGWLEVTADSFALRTD